MTGDVLAVVSPGLHTSVQDAGRFGSQRFGVSPAGAVDIESLAIANALVGNEAGAAALEMTFTGGIYEVLTEIAAIALAGADMPLTVLGRRLEPYRTHLLRRGDRLEIGSALSGLRAYLALSGGIAVAPVLGSRSTHWRSGLGGFSGRSLRAGDRLPGLPQDIGGARLSLRPDRRPYFGGVIRVVPGPQDDAFEPQALEVLTRGRYLLSSQSDRMGARLLGPPLPFRAGFNIVSDGIVAGSIQVPGNGRPIVLLADRQTTGGYPKIATVVTPDLGRIGQRRPNERIVFHVVCAAAAEEEYRNWRMRLDALPQALDTLPGAPAAS